MKAVVKQEWRRDIAKCCISGEVVGVPHKGQLLLKSDLDGEVRAVPKYIYDIQEEE